MGLAYPYGAFSLVEVPARLRGYGGGWRMAAVQTAPGIAMLRESAFPTARFDLATRMRDIPDDESEAARSAMAKILLQFFNNDLSGGNPLYGAAQSFVGYQTGAEGEGAIALDAVVHELALRLLTQAEGGFFSAHTFVGTGFQGMVGESFGRMFAGGAQSLAQDARNMATNRPAVWDSALGTPLASLDPAPDPELALNVIWLKAPVIAQSLVRALGQETVAAFLAELRRRHAGGRFTAEDFAAVAADTGVDLASVVGDWLHDAALPGFLASTAEVFRIEDDEQGQPALSDPRACAQRRAVAGCRPSTGAGQGNRAEWRPDAHRRAVGGGIRPGAPGAARRSVGRARAIAQSRPPAPVRAGGGSGRNGRRRAADRHAA